MAGRRPSEADVTRRAQSTPGWRCGECSAKVLIRRPEITAMCGRSAAGSASPCQGEGRGFESRRPLGAASGHLGGVAERRGNGLQSRVHGFKSRLHLSKTFRAISSAGERFPDTEEVTGSIPVSPTSKTAGHHAAYRVSVSSVFVVARYMGSKLGAAADRLFALTEGFLGPLFFVWLGATLDVRELAQHPAFIGVGAALGLGAFGAHVAMRSTGQPLEFGGLAAAQLGVPIGAVTIGAQLNKLAPGESAAIFVGALFTIAIAVWSGAVAARTAGAGPSRRGASTPLR